MSEMKEYSKEELLELYISISCATRDPASTEYLSTFSFNIKPNLANLQKENVRLVIYLLSGYLLEPDYISVYAQIL